jgi:hypothetical protein
MNVKMTVFLDIVLMMEAASFSETSAGFYKITRCNIPILEESVFMS